MKTVVYFNLKLDRDQAVWN